MINIGIVERTLLLYKELRDMPGIVNLNEHCVKQTPIVSTDLFYQVVTDVKLRKAVEKLYHDGHHARAVEEAFKFLDNLVKRTSRVPDKSLSGSKLMTTVFSSGNPLLRLNSGATMSEEDEQKGYMQIFSGCMTGIRNPRAHEYDWEDSEQRALQLLALANHLVERVYAAETVNKH